MIQKLAVLVVEKSDGSVVMTHGSKGEIYQSARALIHSLNDSGTHDVARVTALGQVGVLKERTWKANIPAVVAPVQEVEAEQDEPEEIDSPADVQALRDALKARGIRVPPRINADTLLALAIEHGIEA
jgi:hypothetical protein